MRAQFPFMLQAERTGLYHVQILGMHQVNENNCIMNRGTFLQTF